MERRIRLARRVAVGAMAAAAVTLVGCSGFRVEHQGNQVGEGLCGLREATNADDLADAIQKINENLDDAFRIAGRPIEEDLSDIQNNLGDLFDHVPDDQEALTQQDINAIYRNAETVAEQTSGYQQRFWQGVTEGLGDCIG